MDGKSPVARLGIGVLAAVAITFTLLGCGNQNSSQPLVAESETTTIPEESKEAGLSFAEAYQMFEPSMLKASAALDRADTKLLEACTPAVQTGRKRAVSDCQMALMTLARQSSNVSLELSHQASMADLKNGGLPSGPLGIACFVEATDLRAERLADGALDTIELMDELSPKSSRETKQLVGLRIIDVANWASDLESTLRDWRQPVGDGSRRGLDDCLNRQASN